MTDNCWIDGGYKEGDHVITSDNVECVLTVSLGSLGWVAKRLDTGKKIILMFDGKNGWRQE